MQIIYLFLQGLRFFYYLFSPSYRRETHQHWKKSKSHVAISEVGAMLMGLIIIGVLVALLVRKLST